MKIFDLHCDTLGECYRAYKRGERISIIDAPLQVNEEFLKQGGYFAQCFASFVPIIDLSPYETSKEMLSYCREEIARSKTLALVERFSDFAKNCAEGKISAVLTIEDAAPLGCSIDRLKEFYQLGVRMIGLTWNYPNAVGFPNFKDFKAGKMPDMYTPETERGLTEFGRELVTEMNELGMAIDVSHLSDKGFFEVTELSKKPVFASHSNARSVCGNVRNLSDEMLKRLAENGGVVGVNYCAAFLNEEEEKGKKTVSQAVAHISRIRNLIGAEHIAFGSDFDGISLAIELSDASKTPLLLAELERSGFTADEIDKICKENALRVFQQTIK